MLNSLIGIIASSGGAAAAANSYESIATVSVGSGGSSSVTFSSIPSTYQHLQIRGIARDSRASGASNLYLQFNSDTSANYTAHTLNGTGTGVNATAEGASQTSAFAMRVAGNTLEANAFGGFVLDILDYANTNKYKTNRSLSGYQQNADGAIWFSSGLWMSTSAVTSITLSPVTSPILQYSSFALYGIKG